MNTNELITFAEIRELNKARQLEWDGDTQFSMLFFSNAMCGEAGEVANVVKKLERARLGLPGSEATKEDLADELADVLTYVDLLANRAGINLGDAWVKKFNKVSDKYGMKTRINVARR